MPGSDRPPIIDPTGKTAEQIEREIEASMVLYGEALITPPYPSHPDDMWGSDPMPAGKLPLLTALEQQQLDAFTVSDPSIVGRAVTNPSVYRERPCPVCTLVGFDCGGHDA